MPPAAGSVTAARTSSTDSGASRNSASLITFTEPRYPDRAPAADRRGPATTITIPCRWLALRGLEILPRAPMIKNVGGWALH